MKHESRSGARRSTDTSWVTASEWLPGQAVLARMRADFRLAIVTLFCFCSVGIITPFALYRLSVGEVLIGVVDLMIVSGFAGLLVFAWRTGRVLLAGTITAGVAAAGVLTVVLALGLSHLWVFSALMAIYLLAERWFALTTSAILIAALALQPAGFASATEHATFIAVSVMVSVFGLIFASRVEGQQSRLVELAARDGLTGAYNRRLLDYDLDQLARRGAVGSGPVSLAIMDLDNFKDLNDDFGHDAGDQVLMELTDLVEEVTRRGDRFYRFGGEEFVLVMPETDLDGAAAVMAKLMAAVRSRLRGPGGPVTLSAGLTQLFPGECHERWLGRADQALLTAKRSGRDRVHLAISGAVPGRTDSDAHTDGHTDTQSDGHSESGTSAREPDIVLPMESATRRAS